MNKRYLSIILAGVISTTIISGCSNNDKVTETTNSAESEATVVEAEPEVVEEPAVSDNEITVSENEVVVAAPVTVEFEWGLATTSYPYEDVEMSHNIMQYTDDNGKIMNFTFDSKESLVAGQYEKDNNLFLTNIKVPFLQAWYGGELPDESTYLKNAPKDIILSLIPAASYTDGEYYEEELNDVYHKIVFAITSSSDGVETKGYACYIDNYDLAECYQFAYLEPTETYDDARALAVVNSISAVR